MPTGEIELTFHGCRKRVGLATGAKGTAVIKFIKTRAAAPVIRGRESSVRRRSEARRK